MRANQETGNQDSRAIALAHRGDGDTRIPMWRISEYRQLLDNEEARLVALRDLAGGDRRTSIEGRLVGLRTSRKKLEGGLEALL